MSDLNEYIAQAGVWDGAFNYMDAVVLAQFAYLPFGADLDEYNGAAINPKGLTIGEFAKLLLAEKYTGILKYRFGSDNNNLECFTEFCKALSQSERYSNFEVFSFSYEDEKESQYNAYCISLGETGVICYRGTDGTYEGWYENFEMLDEVVEAQKFAYRYYLEMKKHFDKIIVTGHSKGGNLAMFTGIAAEYETDCKIKQTFNFDGPGFNRHFIEQNIDLMEIAAKKTFSYLPENSIVGQLMFGQEILYKNLYYIKASDKKGLLYQHSLFMWKINNGALVETKRSSLSKIIDEALDYIIDNSPKESINKLVKLFLLKYK